MRTEPFLLHRLRPYAPTDTVLARAAESIALNTGNVDTVVDFLHGRAFRHYAEGLRQYLCIRLGSVEHGAAVLKQLRTYSESHDQSLLQTPGMRARLYQAAFGIVHDPATQKAADMQPMRRHLPWRASPATSLIENPLRSLRFELAESESELLELHHARELSLQELAFVYGENEAVCRARLDQAERHAKVLLRNNNAEDPERFSRMIIEAFALQSAHHSNDDVQEPEAFPSGTVIGGRYSLQARVGTGAFGDVYRALDTEVPGHVVALKLYHEPSYSETAREAALRELRITAAVFHPSIVQFKDHGWFENRLWFVMPWYDGETLESRLQAGALSRKEALRVFKPLARALEAMHSAGIRHQDIKPENIFLARIPGFGNEEILPVLLDLGVAATDAEVVIAGTPTYFAPEVAAQFASIAKKPLVTQKADVFALALSLRNALEPSTQEDVAAGAVDAFIEMRARQVPPPPYAKNLKFLNGHFERWLSKETEARPSANEFADELDILLAPEKRREHRRTLLRWFLPVVVTVLVVAGSTIAMFQRQAIEQRQEALRAQEAAAGLRKDLVVTQRTAERLRDDIEDSRMTRAQLANKLSSTTRVLNQTEKKLGDETNLREQTQKSLVASQAQNQDLSSDLRAANDALTLSRAQSQKLAADLQSSQAVASQHALKIDELDGSLVALRKRAQQQADQLSEVQRDLELAEQARRETQKELNTLRERVRKLAAGEATYERN